MTQPDFSKEAADVLNDIREGCGHQLSCIEIALQDAYKQGKQDALKESKAVVDQQALDDGLWFKPEYFTEDYLQRALRRLHEAVEGKTQEECAAAILPMLRGDANA